jgi:hypothetical protein
MPSNYLDLQNQINEGAVSLTTPTPNDGCGTNTSSVESDVDLGLNFPDTSSIDNALSDVQNAIDDLGDEVMGVLQDIGAWIPPELFGQGSGSNIDQYLENPSPIDDVEAETIDAKIKNDCITTSGTSQYGASTYQKTWGDESHFAKITDGSFVFSSAKSPKENHNGGRFQVNSAGATIFKVGEAMLIEVENKNNITSGTNPLDSKFAGTAFSLYVTGDVRIFSSKDLSIASEGNLTLHSGKTLTLEGIEGVDILAGTAPTSSTTSEGSGSYGGTINMKASKIAIDKSTEQTTTSTQYQKIDGEGAVVVNNDKGNYGIRTGGSFEIECSGDMWEKIGGRKKTSLMIAAAIPAIPNASVLGGQKSAYIIEAESFKAPAVGGTPEVTSGVDSPILKVIGEGGFLVRASKGDIDMGTKQGNVVIGTENAVFADIESKGPTDKDAPAMAKSLTSGTFFGSKRKLAIYGSETVIVANDEKPPKETPTSTNLTLTKEKVELASSKTTKMTLSEKEIKIEQAAASYISIGSEKIKIFNTSGVYLN